MMAWVTKLFVLHCCDTVATACEQLLCKRLNHVNTIEIAIIVKIIYETNDIICIIKRENGLNKATTELNSFLYSEP